MENDEPGDLNQGCQFEGASTNLTEKTNRLLLYHFLFGSMKVRNPAFPLVRSTVAPAPMVSLRVDEDQARLKGEQERVGS